MGDIDELKGDSIDNIRDIIPNKEPFLFIDKVVSLEKNRIIAIKNIKQDEFFFEGHFVDFPLMPGTLVVEGLGQAGSILIRKRIENPESKDILLYKIKEFSFKKPLFPGNKIRYEVNLIFLDEKRAVIKGKVIENEDIAVEGSLILAIVDKKNFRAKK